MAEASARSIGRLFHPTPYTPRLKPYTLSLLPYAFPPYLCCHAHFTAIHHTKYAERLGPMAFYGH